MSDANKALVRLAMDRYNAADWDGLDALYDPAYVHHNSAAALTLAGFKRGAAWLRAAMPDFHLAIDDLIAEGDRVAMRFTGQGTHRGAMFGETPTGRVLTLYGIGVFRIADGRIAEDWETSDEQYLRDQATGAAT